MAWEGHYTKDNPNGLKATEGGSAAFNFTVNPWPNENDQLDLIYLNGDYGKKEFVKGQTINTGIKVENLDDNARERLVGQVYHPVSGDVVPGAEAYIDENDMVVVKMPEGALKQDANGKTIINKESIFSKAGYKNIQSLDVKFFTRPRTEEEFRKIAVAAQYEGLDYYTPTGAGTKEINHKGQSVTIDKQGIARYDHYNKVGEFKINLDDTMYYDQRFEDGNGDDTTKITSSAVQPEVPFEVKIVPPANPGETDKSAADMNGAQDRGEAAGEIDLDLFEKENIGKKEEDKWNIDYDAKDISKFTVTPPASAKAGDFVAVAVKYTYTNGSTDLHWFHFVVQESTYIKPEYETQVNFPVNKQTSPAKVADDDKRIKPSSYTLPKDLKTDEAGNKLIKDDKGNKWTVTVDETTGEVTAKPVNPDDFDGGEKLTVPVIAHYEDPQKPGEDITENVNAYFVIEEKANMTPRYNAKAGKSGDKLSSDVILNEEDRYNRRPGKFTLESNTYTDDKGNVWNVSIDEKTGTVTATVPNAEEGKTIDGALLNVPVTAHYYEEDEEGNVVEAGTKKTEVQFIASGTDGTYVKKEEIPFETKVEKDPNLKDYEIKVITEGKTGSKKVTYVIKDSEVDETKTKEEILEIPQDRLIHVGNKVEDGSHDIVENFPVPFETRIEFSDDLKPGETKVIHEGELGEQTRTTTIKIQDGKVVEVKEGDLNQIKAPKERVIQVGRNTEGKVEHKEEIPFKYTVEYDPELKAGEYRVETPGRNGERITTWTIKNSKVDGDPKVVETKPIDAVIKVGNKDFTGEFKTTKTEAVEFETEYKVNNELKPGEVKVVQDGELGEKETRVTHTIVNGEVTKSEEGETKQTKAPVKRIVEVGPGTTDGTHTYTSKKPFEVEVRVNPKLPKGEYKILQKGVDGEEEYTITIENSEVTNISDPKETKAPVNEIIEVGEGSTDGEVKHVEEIPFKYQVEESEDLKPGEYKIVKPGKVGTKTTIWTIKDSKVVGDPKEEIVEAEDALIQVGKGTPDGTHDFKEKKEIPFETIIEYDDSLEPGEEIVVQEGKPGEQERTNTIVIENGKVKEIKEGTFETITKPVNKIIKIGRKKAEDETTKTVEKEIPYETKIIYDDTLEAGFQQIEKEGKPGKEKVTITTKIVDGKLVTTESTEKIEDKEDRVVRIGVKPVVKETELGHDTEYRYNPELKEGEEKVIEEGSNGKVEYTITFNKEKGKIEVTEKRTEPKNKIVEIGYKTDGKVKVESEIPFEVEIIEDPEMEAGKTEVVQEGKLGKKETTVTIENSKEVSREENIIKEPVKKIIKVGTKNVCEIPPVKPEDPKDPEKPGEDPKDPEKPGEDPKDPEKPGEDPKDPEQPGEDPKDPDQPGKEDPKDPDQPGKEDPKDPEEPGGEDPKDPDQPGGKDPKDPETPGKTPENNGKTPENNGKTPENNGKTPGATGQVDGKSTTTNNKTPKRLPKSGSESEIMTLAMSGLLTAAGFIGLKKKRKDR